MPVDTLHRSPVTDSGNKILYVADLLYAPAEPPNRIPSPHELMGKIIIKVSKRDYEGWYILHKIYLYILLCYSKHGNVLCSYFECLHCLVYYAKLLSN